MWTARQGHAATFFEGSVYICGGFDEAGYSNSVYRYKCTTDIQGQCYFLFLPEFIVNYVLIADVSAEESKEYLRAPSIQSDVPFNSPAAPGRVDFTALGPCLTVLQDLRDLRNLRDKLIREAVYVVGAVTRVFKFSDFEARKRTGSSTDMLDATIRAATQPLSSYQSQPTLMTRSTPPSSSDLVGENKAPDFSMIGSPFRESALMKIREVAKKDLKAFIVGEDMQLQFWQKLTTFSVEAVTATSPRDSSDNNYNPAAGKSAHLWDQIENDKKAIFSIQQRIRELEDLEDPTALNALIAERAACAQAAFGKVSGMIEHLNKMRTLYEERQNDLLKAISQLETIFNDYSPLFETRSPREQWRSWEQIVQRSSEIIDYTNPFDTDQLQGSLQACLQSISKLASDLSMMVSSSSLTLMSHADDQPVSFDLDYASPDTNIDYKQVSSGLSKALLQQRQISANLEITATTELRSLSIFRTELLGLLYDALQQGMMLVQRVYSQNSVTAQEIARLRDDIVEWKENLYLWENVDLLKQKCDLMVSEASELEEQLLKWENLRIDLKSSTEKAKLTVGRGKHPRSIHGSNSTSSEIVTPEVEKLKNDLIEAEREARASRKELRNWYRNRRNFVVHTAPEMFVALPDFRAPGSVLGDGGFARSANIPRRQLGEYDDVVPFSTGKNDDAAAATGRHLLLKATYGGQEVVLKGFITHNLEQRKGMDREIEILSKLKSDMIISPQAIVDASADSSDPLLQITLFIEYPFYRGGNLSEWLKSEERKPWELQAVARQILYGLMYLHDHGVVHKDIKPSNVLLREDGQIVLTDFELSRVVATSNSNGDMQDDEAVTITRSGTTGFMAPEVESGKGAGFYSDMFAFGMLLYFMHFPRDFAQLVPSLVRFPANADAELCDLILSLLAADSTARPTAASALTHPYFRGTFVDRMMQEGEIVEQDRKLEAVRNLFSRTRTNHRNSFDKINVSRASIVNDVLTYFINVPLEDLRKHLKVTFLNEPGIDEGGPLTEMFSIFFDQVFSPLSGLFEDCNTAVTVVEKASPPVSLKLARQEEGVSDSNEHFEVESYVVLPSSKVKNEDLVRLRAVGRAMVKALYEGRRIGNRLCPSVLKFYTGANPTMRDLQLFDPQAAKSLQWLLTTVGVEDLAMHFEEVDRPDLGPVNDTNKATFVRMKVNKILVETRVAQLTALKAGFTEALQGLSTEAAPFLSFLSHTDWRIMLCGDTIINVQQIVASLHYTGFPRRSKVPQWLAELLLSASEDHLRKFLVFVTGAPSLTSAFGSKATNIKINVRHQARSAALPTAHTCFFHLDIPDYNDRDTFQTKLFFAIQNANSFEIV